MRAVGIRIDRPELYGMYDGRGNFLYQAECPVCHIRNCGYDSEHALFNHLIHSAKKHSYIFEEDYPLSITAQDADLQQAITLSMLYGLPMPGYETHLQCLQQFREGKVVCILHDMKGTWGIKGKRHWLGYL